MVDTNVSRLKKYAEKKTISVSAAQLTFDGITGTTDHQLFQLPPNCLIVGSGVVVDTEANGAITVDFGFDGGAELGDTLDINAATGYISDADVSTVTTLTGTVTALTLTEGTPNTLDSGTVALSSGAGTVPKAPRIVTGTGKTVTATFSAEPTAGDFTFIVEYIEYTLGNGNLTNYVA